MTAIKIIKELGNVPQYSPHYRVLKTDEIGEWVSATGKMGDYELKMPDGTVKTFKYNEIEAAPPENFLDAQLALHKRKSS